MPNHYFQFKQFKIEQEKCAMKVCTDSCLFGAWVMPDENTGTILDIGTGTGLLSLMLAQKCHASIHGVEIDEAAYSQTKENFEHSIWKDRLSVSLGDVRSFDFPKPFDFIICNPPFYENVVDSHAHGEKIAKHSLHLTLSYLICSIEKLLNSSGKFAILLPFYRKDEMEQLALRHGYFPEKTIYIRQTYKHDFFRYAAIFSGNAHGQPSHEEISIKNAENHYTAEAIALLQPYYLFL